MAGMAGVAASSATSWTRAGGDSLWLTRRHPFWWRLVDSSGGAVARAPSAAWLALGTGLGEGQLAFRLLAVGYVQPGEFVRTPAGELAWVRTVDGSTGEALVLRSSDGSPARALASLLYVSHRREPAALRPTPARTRRPPGQGPLD
jgi:hypothetical protein